MSDREWSNAGYQAVAQYLGGRAGLWFRASQRESIELAIDRAMGHTTAGDLDAYLHLLRADAAKLDDLLVQTTVGETYFFRDPGQLEYVRKQILPEINRRRDPSHTLRFWCAGCASGEEPYSLAMLLHRQGLLSRASVLGTDISRESLERARQASYRDWSLRGKGKELAEPYLAKVDGRYHVSSMIQRAVHFEYLNLALDQYPSTATGTRGVDLILCRNVMIYFDRETIRSVVTRFHRCLMEGGWLVVAASDPQIHDYDLFEVVSTDHGMFFRKGAANTTAREFFSSGLMTSAEIVSNASAPQTDTNDQRADSPTTTPTPPVDDRLASAQEAMDAGEYERAAELVVDLLHLDEAAIIQVKALANRDIGQAERACAAAAERRPLSTEVHYLHAILLMDLNRHSDAADTLRRVLYLDRSLALAHYSLGTALRTLGDLEGAQRALRTAQEICVSLAADDLLPLGENDRAGDLLEITNLQLETIKNTTGVRS